MSEDERDEESAAAIDERDAVEPLEELDEPETGKTVQRDPLSIAIVAGLAALLLICVVLIFVANRHRPAGL